jgi:hypothetical protein
VQDRPQQPAQSISLKSLVGSVYLPTFLSRWGRAPSSRSCRCSPPIWRLHRRRQHDRGHARHRHALAMDVPGGILESKLGDKFVMIAGTAIVAVVALGPASALAPAAGATDASHGLRLGIWLLARLAYVSDAPRPSARPHHLHRRWHQPDRQLWQALVSGFGPRVWPGGRLPSRRHWPLPWPR